MGDLSETTRNTLLTLAAPAIFCAMLLIGRWLKRGHRVRLGWSYHLFSLSLAALVVALAVGLGEPFRSHLVAAVAIFGSLFLIALVDRFVWERHFKEGQGVEVPRFITEIVRLGILIVVFAAVLSYVYGQNVRGLLLAPGLAALVLGFAMQDLLGNIIAGISLQIGKPYVEGDWLILDQYRAEVVEINWRSTRLRTNDEVTIEIPNRQMANHTITNLSRPTRRHAMRLSVGVDYDALPARVKEVLVHAAANATGVLPAPLPKAFLKNFGESEVEYEIKFWIEDQAQYSDICDAIRTNVWYELHRRGIRIPFPMRTVRIERPAHDVQRQAAAAVRALLRQQPLLQSLTDVQLDALLPRSRVLHFGPGEKLIEQGAEGDSMFILVDGQAKVVVERTGVVAQVATLKAGDCVGEMSLLTGEPRRATVTAEADCEVIEITKLVLAGLLKEFPELLDKLSELLARREVETEGVVATHSRPSLPLVKETEYKANFGAKLKKFFEL